MKKVVHYTESVRLPGRHGDGFTISAATPDELRDALLGLKAEVDAALKRIARSGAAS